MGFPNNCCSAWNVLLPGTSSQAVYFNDLYSVNIETSEWESVSVKNWLPLPRASMGFVEAGDRLFIFGGNSTGEDNV